jgi:hypothetical protein
MSDTESILPEILIDDTADEYVETDDEPGTPSPKTRPPANEIFYQDEEPPEDEPAPPAVEPTFNYVKPAKPKRHVSEKQRQHLATIRTKALETRKANAKAKRDLKLKAQPTPAPTPAPAPAPAPTPAPARFNDTDVDQLLDRYKARRRVKKAAAQQDEEVRRKVQHVTAPPPQDDPWAECFL